MKGIMSIVAGLILITATTLGGCMDSEKEESTTAVQQTVPGNYATYKEDGFFSISYPIDWEICRTDEIELVKEIMLEEFEDTEDLAVLDELSFLFMAGEVAYDGYYPTVSVGIVARTPGYWSLDEIYESGSEYEKEYTEGFKLISKEKTTIDGIDAIIDVTEDNEPGWGKWRYVQMLMVADKHVWWITCSCEASDFSAYEEDFHQIMRNFKLYKR